MNELLLIVCCVLLVCCLILWIKYVSISAKVISLCEIFYNQGYIDSSKNKMLNFSRATLEVRDSLRK